MNFPSKIKLLIRFWAPVVLWGLVIFAFSSQPTGTASQISWQDFIIKKVAHILVYGTFATLNFRALIASGMKREDAAVSAIVISLIYGLTDEIHQSFTPGREPRLRDVGFDTIGASIAIYLIWNYIPKAPKILKNWARDFQLT